jgi:hypothetical protein
VGGQLNITRQSSLTCNQRLKTSYVHFKLKTTFCGRGGCVGGCIS